MFRETHTLKGAARAAGYGAIASLCQATESAYAALKEVDGPVPDAVLQALLQAHGIMYNILRGSAAESHVAAIERLERVSAEVLTAAPKSPEPQNAPPPPAPAPTAPELFDLTAPADSGPVSVTLPESVRISLPKLEALRLALDELLPARQAVRRITGEVGQLLDADSKDLNPAAANALREVQNELVALEKTLSLSYGQLRSSAQDLVMLPLSLLFQPLAIAVNDISTGADKQVSLKSHGGELVIDRRILEDVREILLHLVRNAVDHGIETPAERRSMGKPETGHITITARHLKFDTFELLIEDDGKGIDVEAVKRAGSALSAPGMSPRHQLSDEEALQLIFRPHLSTVSAVNEVSGRGLGMSIVGEKVSGLKGEIVVTSHPYEGTTFRLVLPVAQRSFRAMVIKSGSHEFVLPLLNVKAVMHTSMLDVRTVEGVPAIAYQDAVLPVHTLSGLLGAGSAGALTSHPMTIIVSAGSRSIALAIDTISAEEEVVKKHLGFPLQNTLYYEGAANTSSGMLLPILKVEALLEPATVAGGRVAQTTSATPSRRPRVLVADDSVTSRLFLRHVLEGGGYEVELAVDGADAWNTLLHGSFDAIVSDVEMPRQNGFELTARVRSESRFSALPVILVTALAKEEHRQRGLDAGASAYIVKGGFNETNLLEALEKLI